MITRSISFYLNCFSYGLRVSWSPSSLCVLWCAQCLECYSRKASSIRVNTPGFLFFVFSFLGRARWALLRQSFFFFAPLSLLLFFTCFFSPFLGKGSATKKDLPPYVFFFYVNSFRATYSLGWSGAIWTIARKESQWFPLMSGECLRKLQQPRNLSPSSTYGHFSFFEGKSGRHLTIRDGVQSPPPPGASNWGQHS